MDEKAKILIVEDELIIARGIRDKLESMGYDVSAIVSSGEDAIKKAEELHPDLVLMDIILRGEMDGVEAAGQIRTHLDIPVVYVTANVSDARLGEITRSEPFGCLFKPFEDMELQAAVKMALYKHKMGKELKKSERMLRLITENMNDMVLLIDLNGKIQYAGPSLKDILGYEPEEWVGVSSFEVMHPEDLEHVGALFETAIAASKPGRVEYRVRHADGHYIWVEGVGNFVFDEDGTAVGGIMNIREITDRRRAEKVLHDSEKKYRTLAETTNDVTFVLDMDGKFTYISPVVEKLTGYSWQDFLGHHFTEFVAPEYVKSTTEHFKKGLAGKELPLIEIEVRHKDGGTVPVELNVSSLTDATGKTTGRIGVARDITDRKQAEEGLRKSEERFRTIFESIKEGYAELDLAGRFTFVNETTLRMMRFPSEKVIGVSFEEYTSPETVERLYGIFNEVYRTGESAEITGYEIIRGDGSKAVMELSAYLTRDEKGEPVGFRGITRDVTERRAIEEALRESEEKYRTILEGVENGYWEVDLSGRFTFFNDALCRIHGLPAEKLMGMSNREYSTPETAKSVYEVYNKVYRTGKPAEIANYETVLGDGTKGVFELSISLMRDEDGNPIGFRGITRDVTERRAMGAALRESEEKYRRILEEIEDGYWEVDLEGRFTFFNDALCRMVGVPAEELVGMGSLENTPPRNDEGDIHDIQRGLPDRKPSEHRRF